MQQWTSELGTAALQCGIASHAAEDDLTLDKTLMQDLRELKYSLSTGYSGAHRKSVLDLSAPLTPHSLVRARLGAAWHDRVDVFFKNVFPRVLVIATGLSNKCAAPHRQRIHAAAARSCATYSRTLSGRSCSRSGRSSGRRRTSVLSWMR